MSPGAAVAKLCQQHQDKADDQGADANNDRSANSHHPELHVVGRARKRACLNEESEHAEPADAGDHALEQESANRSNDLAAMKDDA